MRTGHLRYGEEPNDSPSSGDIDTIKRAVEIDLGVSMLPEGTVLHEARNKTLARSPDSGAR